MTGELFKPDEKREKAKEILPFWEEINGLAKKVIDNNNFRNSLSTPKGLNRKSFLLKTQEIDFTKEPVINLLGQMDHFPEERRNMILYNAGYIKSQFGKGLSDDEAIQYAMGGVDISKLRLKFETNVDVQNIMEIMFNAIDEGKDPFKGVNIPIEKGIADKDISNQFKDGERVLSFEKLPPKTQKTLLEGINFKYETLFKGIISEALEENPNITPSSLFYNNNILEFYVKYYNVQQYLESLDTNKPYFPFSYESLTIDNKQTLQEYFETDLSSLGFDVDNVNDTLLKEKEERNRRLREENQKKLEEWKKRNEELNARSQGNDSEEIVTNEPIDNNQSEKKLTEDASGLEIAEAYGLGKQLVEQYNNEYQDESQYDEQAISIAWSKFIVTADDDLKGTITEETFQELYDSNSNTIKEYDDEARNGLKEIFKNQPEKFEHSDNGGSDFHSKFSPLLKMIEETKEELHKNSTFAKAVQNENNNNVAVASVIDNVKDVFSKILGRIEGGLGNKGFKFNDNKPARIEGDNLMILGKFNGAEVLVRYNLKSGEIFMNSFLQFQEDSKKIILGNDDDANYKVGQLESFDNILSNQESLNSQVDLISDADVEKQSAINSIVVKFMKTFNVITDSQNIENIEINNGSDLFDFLEIISNSDPDNLEIFQTAMEKLMEYSGLIWGVNNPNGQKENGKSGVNNSYATTLKDSIKVFTENPDIFKNKINFESDYKFGFLQMVIKNFKEDGIDKPNRKLNGAKIKDFLHNLETESEVS